MRVPWRQGCFLRTSNTTKDSKGGEADERDWYRVAHVEGVFSLRG